MLINQITNENILKSINVNKHCLHRAAPSGAILKQMIQAPSINKITKHS